MVRPIRVVMMIAALVALLAGSAALYAQAGPGGGRGRGGAGMGPGGPGGGLPLRQLNLTDAQRDQVRQIMEQYRPQFEELNSRLQNDIRAVLTPEQQQRADAFRAERDAKMKERRQRRSPNVR
jgi:Spy/CpxP family protein refolding chaperone